MEALELLEILSRGEDSRHQFKRDFTNAEQLAAEMAAFANTAGGQLFLGVEDDGSLAGLTGTDIRRLNQLVTNAATNNVRSPLDPFTEIINVDGALVLVVTIADGINRVQPKLSLPPFGNGAGFTLLSAQAPTVAHSAPRAGLAMRQFGLHPN